MCCRYGAEHAREISCEDGKKYGDSPVAISRCRDRPQFLQEENMSLAEYWGSKLKSAVKRPMRRVVSHLARFHSRIEEGRSAAGELHQQTGSGQSRVSEYWNKQFEAMRSDNSYWLNNKIVEESTYRLMTGGPTHWLTWLLNDFLKEQTFARSLSVCCGDGAHEIQLYKSGKIQVVTGFDISEGAIRQAVARFHEAGASTDRFRFEVKDVNNLHLEGQFDLIFSTGALHHTTNLEDVLANLQRVLSPDGYFVMVEFIGPNRFQWTDRQIEVANKLLNALDPQYLKNGYRETFERPTIECMLKSDPSEAVRSEEVYALVKQHFSVVYERFYNGTILHQLHPLLQSQLANQQRKDFDSIVRLILVAEDLLVSNGVLPSDFVFLICQAKGRRPANDATNNK
jgi:ubiquinone/menaquinone biosynthesis C-methylase UbiE